MVGPGADLPISARTGGSAGGIFILLKADIATEPLGAILRGDQLLASAKALDRLKIGVDAWLAIGADRIIGIEPHAEQHLHASVQKLGLGPRHRVQALQLDGLAVLADGDGRRELILGAGDQHDLAARPFPQPGLAGVSRLLRSLVRHLVAIRQWHVEAAVTNGSGDVHARPFLLGLSDDGSAHTLLFGAALVGFEVDAEFRDLARGRCNRPGLIEVSEGSQPGLHAIELSALLRFTCHHGLSYLGLLSPFNNTVLPFPLRSVKAQYGYSRR